MQVGWADLHAATFMPLYQVDTCMRELASLTASYSNKDITFSRTFHTTLLSVGLRRRFRLRIRQSP